MLAFFAHLSVDAGFAQSFPFWCSFPGDWRTDHRENGTERGRHEWGAGEVSPLASEAEIRSAYRELSVHALVLMIDWVPPKGFPKSLGSDGGGKTLSRTVTEWG